jgi:hypothetical protein
VTITSEEEQKTILALIADGQEQVYWLGGQRSGNNWVWVTGEQWSYTNWNDGEPNNSGGSEKYVQIWSSKTGKWNDKYDTAIGFICEYEAVTAPPIPAVASVNQSSPGLYVGNEYHGEMDIYDMLEWITLNAQDGGEYSIVLGSDQAVSAVLFNYGDKRVTVSLKATEGERKVMYAVSKPSSPLFTVNKGVTFTLEDGVILTGVQNSAASLVQVSGGTFIMNGGAIKDNKKSGDGGGVIVDNSGVFTMNDGIITGNSSSNGGGGISITGGIFTMNGGTINGNIAPGNRYYNGGGGVYMVSGSFTMNNGTISGNTAGHDGGGVCVLDGTFTMSGGSISENTADYWGGGVIVYDNGIFTMSNGIFSGNTAGQDGGGVCTQKTFTMSGGSISGNTADNSGGGVYIGTNGGHAVGTFTMGNGIISGNTAGHSGGGVYADIFIKAAGADSIIYGSNAPEELANKAGGEGQAVYVGNGRKRDTTTRATTALDSTKSGAAGGWE